MGLHFFTVDVVLNAILGSFGSDLESEISKVRDAFEKYRIWFT
jgi:hypothetical protein